MSSSAVPTPLLFLTPSQVLRSAPEQWLQAVKQALADARCATPAFLTEDLDPTTTTVTVQIAIQERMRMPSAVAAGSAWMDIPPIIKVPIALPRGGGFSFTLPLKKGDEGLLVFCDTCFDLWWKHGQTSSPAPTMPKGAPSSGSQRQLEVRRHHVHDCGFIPGMCSQPNMLSNYSTTSAQLRSDDGTTIVDVDALGSITITAPSGITADTPGSAFSTTGDAAIGGNLAIASGASGVFSTGTGQTVTVQDGVVIDIS
jgi:hypothetical protein